LALRSFFLSTGLSLSLSEDDDDEDDDDVIDFLGDVIGLPWNWTTPC